MVVMPTTSIVTILIDRIVIHFQLQLFQLVISHFNTLVVVPVLDVVGIRWQVEVLQSRLLSWKFCRQNVEQTWTLGWLFFHKTWVLRKSMPLKFRGPTTQPESGAMDLKLEVAKSRVKSQQVSRRIHPTVSELSAITKIETYAAEFFPQFESHSLSFIEARKLPYRTEDECDHIDHWITLKNMVVSTEETVVLSKTDRIKPSGPIDHVYFIVAYSICWHVYQIIIYISLHQLCFFFDRSQDDFCWTHLQEAYLFDDYSLCGNRRRESGT